MTFDPFGDFQTRGYLRNVFADRDTKIIKRREHQLFRFQVREALDALAVRPSLNYRDVTDTHRRLFVEYYPWAGQDRASLIPDRAVGKAGRYDLFSHPLDCQRAILHGLSLGQDKSAMRQRPGEVMGLLAYAHPFLEGNSRVLMVIHSDLARRADMHIQWELVEKQPYLAALTKELEGPGAGRLDAFLAPFVHEGARAIVDTATMLMRNPNLGPQSPAAPGASEEAFPTRPRSGPSP